MQDVNNPSRNDENFGNFILGTTPWWFNETLNNASNDFESLDFDLDS